jgi:hypothetical protein
MANNEQPPPDSQAAPTSKDQQIAAVLGQILRHMPLAERVKKLRKRWAVMPSAEILADPEGRERTRRIASRSPKPHQGPELPEIET